MSQIKDALAAAGYEDAEDWPCAEIRRIAQDAMVKHADDSNAAQRALFDACCRRTSLLRALVLPWQRTIAAAVIANERRFLKAAERAENLSPKQRELAKVVALEEQRAGAAAQAARQRFVEERARVAHQREVEINEWLKNKARHETVDGTPWWEVTPERLRNFAKRTTHRSKFYELILERMPIHDDVRPVSYYLRPGEIDPLWDEAWGNETPD